MLQETSRLRNRSSNITDNLATVEIDLRTCREALDRSISDKECLQRQSASQLLELDRLRQEKESLEMQHRVLDREGTDLREKLSSTTRNLGCASGSIAQLEAAVCQLRGTNKNKLLYDSKCFEIVIFLEEVKLGDEKCQRLQSEHRGVMESLAVLLSTPARFVESLEGSIKDRIRELMGENREKTGVKYYLIDIKSRVTKQNIK